MDQEIQEKESSSVEFVTIPIGYPTLNDRIYSKAVVEKALTEYKEKIEQRKAFVTTFSEGNVVNLRDIVGLVNEAKIENDRLVIKMEVLDTPMTNMLKTSEGVFDVSLVKVAPFGMGSLKENVVQEDFQLLGFHIVPNHDQKNENW